MTTAGAISAYPYACVLFACKPDILTLVFFKVKPPLTIYTFLFPSKVDALVASSERESRLKIYLVDPHRNP